MNKKLNLFISIIFLLFSMFFTKNIDLSSFENLYKTDLYNSNSINKVLINQSDLTNLNLNLNSINQNKQNAKQDFFYNNKLNNSAIANLRSSQNFSNITRNQTPNLPFGFSSCAKLSLLNKQTLKTSYQKTNAQNSSLKLKNEINTRAP